MSLVIGLDGKPLPEGALPPRPPTALPYGESLRLQCLEAVLRCRPGIAIEDAIEMARKAHRYVAALDEALAALRDRDAG